MTDIALSLEQAFADYGETVRVVGQRRGPLVTTYELSLQRGTKSKKIFSLAGDVGRTIGVSNLRIAQTPGKSTLQAEIPNEKRDNIPLMDILFSREFMEYDGNLPVVLGRSMTGDPVVADLATMPHLLVAGTTGSGKSVGVNGMIISLLMRFTCDECKFLFIDPKMLELSIYDGIPHLLEPTVTDPREAIDSLQRVVDEMERRYRMMSNSRVRNISNFNEISDEKLPYVVVVIDEFADLVSVAGKALEGLVQRIAQKARAAGIHIIMATQRPSVDVVTGVLKANLPTRISYRVASSFDSRTIIGEDGAETLLGKGDLLFMEGSETRRIHGAFLSDSEVENIVDNIRAEAPTATPVLEVVKEPTVKDQIKKLIEGGHPAKPFSVANTLNLSVFDVESILMDLGVYKGF